MVAAFEEPRTGSMLTDRRMDQARKMAETRRRKKEAAEQHQQLLAQAAAAARGEESAREGTSAKKRKKAPGSLEKSFGTAQKDFADLQVARWVFAYGLPFRIVESHYFKEMVKAIGSAGGK